jgi:hypothetical protein
MQLKKGIGFFCTVFFAAQLMAQEPADKPFWVVEDGKILFFDANGYETDTYQCGEASITELDLNSDGYEELIVTLKRNSTGVLLHSMVIFDGNRVFSYVDSLYSGIVAPEVDYHLELNSFVIICGNPVMDSVFLAKGSRGSYNPLRYFVYDGEQLPDISADLYEDFSRTNEMLIEMLTGQFNDDLYICETSARIFGTVITIVLNYIASEEKALAQKYFEKFYNCPDKQQIFIKIQELF